MNSQLFLLINILGAIFFTTWFMLGRKSKKRPVQLEFGKAEKSPGSSKSPVDITKKEVQEDKGSCSERDVTQKPQQIEMGVVLNRPLNPEEAKNFAALTYQRKVGKVESPPSSTTYDSNSKVIELPLAPHFRNLNVQFIYNGHDWDAHRVLGVPPGASLAVVTEAYQQLIRKMDRDSFPFLEAAYRAILDSSRRKKNH